MIRNGKNVACPDCLARNTYILREAAIILVAKGHTMGAYVRQNALAIIAGSTTYYRRNHDAITDGPFADFRTAFDNVSCDLVSEDRRNPYALGLLTFVDTDVCSTDRGCADADEQIAGANSWAFYLAQDYLFDTLEDRC